MSYYGYYGYDTYGDDTAAPTDAPVDTYYEEAAPVEMEEDDEKALGPVAMPFVLVPLVDFFVYYKINDFNTLKGLVGKTSNGRTGIVDISLLKSFIEQIKLKTTILGIKRNTGR